MPLPLPPREVWLRGQPVDDVPPLLQPVAHGLLQCGEEIAAIVPRLAADLLWATPSGAASIGFHVRHAAGALDRLFTYARDEALSPAQFALLKGEGEPDWGADVGARLAAGFDAAVSRAIDQLRRTDPATLLDPRVVGRARMPSTVIGLLFHAAEHTQRHVGQIVTTARIVSARATA